MFAMREVMVEDPPMVSVPDAPLVKLPAPESAVLMVKRPLFVYVPEIETFEMIMAVDPPIAFPAPENVCVPVLEIKLVALLVKLPAKI